MTTPGKQAKQALMRRESSLLPAPREHGGADHAAMVPGKATRVPPAPAGLPAPRGARVATGRPYRFEDGVAIVRSAWLRGTAAPDATHVQPARMLELLIAARAAGIVALDDDQLAAAARELAALGADPLGADVRLAMPGAVGTTGAGHTWAADVAELAPRLGLGAVDVRTDGGARSITEGKDARGVALGSTIYLHPDRIRPGTREGREVLAHELVHLAQARLARGAEQDGERDAAEHEARTLAARLADGAAVAAPRHGIDLSRPAADRDALPDPSSKYGFAMTLAERKLGDHISLSGDLQAYLKDQDGTETLVDRGGRGDVRGSLLSQEAYIRGKGEALVGQIATSVAKIENLWDLDELRPMEGVDLTFKVETKLFDAAFSSDKISVDLAKMTFALEADITDRIFGETARGRAAAAIAKASTVKLSLKLSVRLPADVVANVYRLHRAKQDLLAASKAKQQLKASERALRKAEKKLAKAGALVSSRGRDAMQRVLEARQRHARAKAVWKKGRELAIRAAKTMQEVGRKLAKTAAGRAAGKLSAGAMRLVPGLNAIMVGKDLIEAGVLVYQLVAGNAELRFGGGDGGGAEEGSDEEGEGSEEIDGERGDGDASSAGDGESGDGDEVGGARDGGGRGDGRSGTEDGNGGHVIDGEVTEADLDPLEHHGVAKQILGGLEVGQGEAGKGLSPEDEAVLDSVIPPDLDATEIAELLARVRSTGTGEEADMVTAIVAALEDIRPDGEKRVPAPSRPSAPRPARDKGTPRRRNHAWRAGAAKAKARAKQNAGERAHVDPRPKLQARTAMLPGMRITTPQIVSFDGITARVERKGATSVDGVNATVWVTLTVTDFEGDNAYLDTAAGPARIQVGSTYEVEYTFTARDQGERTEGP